MDVHAKKKNRKVFLSHWGCPFGYKMTLFHPFPKLLSLFSSLQPMDSSSKCSPRAWLWPLTNKFWSTHPWVLWSICAKFEIINHLNWQPQQKALGGIIFSLLQSDPRDSGCAVNEPQLHLDGGRALHSTYICAQSLGGTLNSFPGALAWAAAQGRPGAPQSPPLSSRQLKTPRRFPTWCESTRLTLHVASRRHDCYSQTKEHVTFHFQAQSGSGRKLF